MRKYGNRLPAVTLIKLPEVKAASAEAEEDQDESEEEGSEVRDEAFNDGFQIEDDPEDDRKISLSRKNSEYPESMTAGCSVDKLCVEIPVDLDEIYEEYHEDLILHEAEIEEE